MNDLEFNTQQLEGEHLIQEKDTLTDQTNQGGIKNPRDSVLQGFKITALKVNCSNRLSRNCQRGRVEENQWCPEEEQKLLEMHNLMGNRWTSLAKLLPGRDDNNIKNHFFSRIRMALRHLLRQVGKKFSPKTKIQEQVLYKIVSVSDEIFNYDSPSTRELICTAQGIRVDNKDLKNRLLNYFFTKLTPDSEAISLVNDISTFSCHFHRRRRNKRAFDCEEGHLNILLGRNQTKQKEQNENHCGEIVKMEDEERKQKENVRKQQEKELNKQDMKSETEEAAKSDNDELGERYPLMLEWEPLACLNFHNSSEDSWQGDDCKCFFSELCPFSLSNYPSIHISKEL